jgi:hypothetical protein
VLEKRNEDKDVDGGCLAADKLAGFAKFDWRANVRTHLLAWFLTHMHLVTWIMPGQWIEWTDCTSKPSAVINVEQLHIQIVAVLKSD